jgi:hypothetical protein
LSGSINATRKALTTTDKVELVVLRVVPPGSLLLKWDWEPSFHFDSHARLWF